MKDGNGWKNKNKLWKSLKQILFEIKREEYTTDVYYCFLNKNNKTITIYLNGRFIDSFRKLSPLIQEEFTHRGYKGFEVVISTTNDFIDEYLSYEFNLYYYIELLRSGIRLGRDNKPYLYFSLLDQLQFMPLFQKEVRDIRKKLNININNIRKRLLILLGKKDCEYYREYLEVIIKKFKLNEFNSDRFNKIEAKLKEWENNNFPKLIKLVRILRIRKLKKMPVIWQRAIEQYVLYDFKNSLTPLFYRKRFRQPDISLRLDKNKSEVYLEIRIYPDTDLSFFKKIQNIKDIQKLIPTYFDPNSYDDFLNTKRFVYFLLRKQLKLTHEQANSWLEEKGYGDIESQHTTREIERFLNIFVRKLPKKLPI